VAFFVVAGVATCFSGVKRVGDREPCAPGDQVFEASATCADGLVCYQTLSW
jgi:hypothetical protein